MGRHELVASGGMIHLAMSAEPTVPTRPRTASRQAALNPTAGPFSPVFPSPPALPHDLLVVKSFWPSGPRLMFLLLPTSAVNQRSALTSPCP